MGVPYTWEGEHRSLHSRIDTDARVLDRVAKQYQDDFDKAIKEVYNIWGQGGKLVSENMVKPISLKQKAMLQKRMQRWIDSGIYAQDKQFIRKLERMITKPIIRRQEFLEINIRRVTSEIKIEQSPLLLKSLYQTWLDSERTVARIMSTSFQRAGDDFIYKKIAEKFQGTSLISRMFNQASMMTDQFMRASSLALAQGVSYKGMKQVIKYFFSKGDYRARRILVTESARINTEAKFEAYKKNDVKLYQYVSVMDDRTTDICVWHDLKVYKVSKMVVGKNAPPMHVNCRSTTKAYFIDDRSGQGGNYPP